MATTTGFASIKLDKPGRGRIYNSIVETIGNTPLVRVPNLAARDGIVADLCLKLEFFNPMASVKDRLGVAMILDLEEQGKIGPGSVLIEPTSGNTGISLAFAGAARGYRTVIVMPESQSQEKIDLLRLVASAVHYHGTEPHVSEDALRRAWQSYFFASVVARTTQPMQANPGTQPDTPAAT